MQAFATKNTKLGSGATEGAKGKINPQVRNILRAGVQPKLKIGAVNDPAEVEADRVADQVMRMPSPVAADAPLVAPSPPGDGAASGHGGTPPPIRRKCAACEDEKVQRKQAKPNQPVIRRRSSGADAGGAPASAEASTAIRSLGSGSPLPTSERSFFEPRFGRDLSGVRIHTGGTADAASKAINARAFSLANNIAFASGEYQPGTQSGRTLMAHEITHTLQGGSGVNRLVRRQCDVPDALSYYGRNTTYQWTEGLVEQLYEVAGPGAETFYDRTMASRQIDESFVRLACAAQSAMGFSGSSVDGQIGSGTIARFTEWQTWSTDMVDMNLCFVPIRWNNLGQAGLLHAVLNIPNGRGIFRAEVDPSTHQGPMNPMGEASAVSGWHSHVVTAGSAQTSGECQSISATRQQAMRAIAAVRQYETLDVVYAPPGIGPNSNSFPEWVLHNAGINTAGIAHPRGALGWSYFRDNPDERQRPPRVARRRSQTQATCSGRGSAPRNFAQLIDVTRGAEQEMITNGVSDVYERLSILRGIYYGSPWSIDYETSQGSHIRNEMFNVYVDPSGPGQPRNPLEVMDCRTYLALAATAEISDPSGRVLDIGHLFIGMDARQSVGARTAPQPIGQVTGLEAVTWAGDLGGAAARTAIDRTSNVSKRAIDYFTGSRSDYGGDINLEGDVAAYAVAQDTGWSIIDATALDLSSSGQGIADALDRYVNPATPSEWNNRCQSFVEGIGGDVSSTGTITNRSDVLDYLSEQIADFACWYLVAFVRRGSHLTSAQIQNASRHVEGAGRETAEIFLASLEHCIANPTDRLRARGRGPAPTAAGSETCYTALAYAASRDAVGEAID